MTSETKPIARIWSGRTGTAEASLRYREIFTGQVLPVLRALDGFAGSTLLRRDFGAGSEFVALTRFDSMDAVRAFAGDNPDQAHVTGPARAVLSDFDTQVRHYCVVAGT
ncbi:MAG: antibiotic biosynthesis monooxygenase [Stackebrandtia sp.]